MNNLDSSLAEKFPFQIIKLRAAYGAAARASRNEGREMLSVEPLANLITIWYITAFLVDVPVQSAAIRHQPHMERRRAIWVRACDERERN